MNPIPKLLNSSIFTTVDRMVIATTLVNGLVSIVTLAELDSKITPCTYWLSIFHREAHGSLTDSVWRRLFWKFILHRRKALGTPGLEMRNKRENPSQSCRRLWTQKLQFIYFLHNSPNQRIESPFILSLPPHLSLQLHFLYFLPRGKS